MQIQHQRYIAQPHQTAVHLSKARFRTVANGRRSGKTECAAFEMVIQATTTPNKICWWVAPYYKQARIGMRKVLKYLPKEYLLKPPTMSSGDLSIYLINGTIIQFLSADNPEALRGEGVWFMVVDEAATIKDMIWYDILRPTLADALMFGGGRALIIGTPKGFNWFYELWKAGQDKTNWTEVQSWRFPTSINKKYVPMSEIEYAKKTLPHNSFLQEWEAQFLSDAGAVFRNIDSSVYTPIKYDSFPIEIEKPNPDKFYLIGIDIAKHQDFTVLTIMDSTGRVIYLDRWQELDYVFQCNRILTICKRYNHNVTYMDSTGVGDPIYDFLSKHMSIESFKFTSDSKANLIQNLMVTMAHGEIMYPNCPVLLEELRSFEYSQNSISKKYRYSAPDGKHDDCVMSLALAAWGLKNRSEGSIEFIDIKGSFGVRDDSWS